MPTKKNEEKKSQCVTKTRRSFHLKKETQINQPNVLDQWGKWEQASKRERIPTFGWGERGGSWERGKSS